MGTTDSKLQYQKAAFLMHQKHVPASEVDFWKLFWTLPTSIDDIFNTLNPDDVRLIRKHHPENLATLLHKSVSNMAHLVHVGSKASYAEQNAAINSARLFARILPILLEDQNDDFVQKVFWQNQIPMPRVAEQGANSGPEPILEEIFLEGDAPLAIRLVQNLIQLCFTPNFTIAPPSTPWKEGEDVPLTWAWYAGTATTLVGKSWAQLEVHRADLLRCMLAISSSPLYRTSAEEMNSRNKFLELIVAPSNYSRVFFHSLLNSALSYDPVGWGIPYNHVLFRDTKEPLTIASLHFLILCCTYPPSRTLPAGEPPVENAFLRHLRELRAPEDFKFILKALEYLLTNRLTASRTYLPSSTKSIGFVQELLMLLWKFITENKLFVAYLIKHGNLSGVVVPVLYLLHEHRKDPARVGLVHLGTFILLCLSGEREFCVALNAPFTPTIPIDLPPFEGCLADLLLLVVHRLLTDGQQRLYSLYECLLTILVNVSPYIKSLSMMTCVKLVKLFEALSKPSFLFATERNHRYLTFLLEAFNNIIQYQYPGNYRLVYSLVQNRERFQDLVNLQVPIAHKGPLSPSEPSASPVASKSGKPSDAKPVEAPAFPAKPTEAKSTEAKPAEAKPAEAKPQTPAPAEPKPAAKPSEAKPAEVKPAEAKPSPPPAAAKTSEAKPVEVKPAEAKPSPPSAAVHASEAKPAEVKPAETKAPEVSAPVAALPVNASEVKVSRSREDGRWVPTAEWLAGVKAQLPIATIDRMLAALVPQLHSLATGSADDEAAILAWLQKTTLVGILPVPHPIMVRQYQPNQVTDTWFVTFLWGTIFLQSKSPALFSGTTPRLFAHTSSTA